MRRFCLGLVTLLPLAACGDDPGLSDYFPELPPTGGAQGASAGEVTDPSQLVAGPAAQGLVGDFFIKNDRVTFIIQAPTRVIGVIPQGGNIVDAVLTDGTTQTVEDHFGELSLIYLLGRTCEPDRIEVVRDGSRGGPAVLRAIGKSGNNDFINIKGIGVLPVDEGVDPDIDDGVLCATTYVLEPGTTTLGVHHSLFNPGSVEITGPLGTLADTGGITEAWTNLRGFERADISALTTLSKPQPIDFVLYQGPGVAYGVIPRHETPTVHSQALIAGVSILLDGNASLLEILQKDKYFLKMPGEKGYLQSYDVVVAKDAALIDEVYRTGVGEALQPIAGRVTMSAGGPAVGARVGVYVDGNGNGTIEDGDLDANNDGAPDDRIISYLDVAADGTFSGNVATAAGTLLLRAEVKNIGRSAPVAPGESIALTIPSPIKIDFQILDEQTDMPIPGQLTVIGTHPAHPDKRVFEVADRLTDVVEIVHAVRGTTVDVGDGVDPALYLPAGGTYRIYATRGTEWSVASQPVTGDANLTFRLRHVNPSPGYVSSEWHVHQVGSPDSPVSSDDRVRSAIAAGVEMFAVTDHDYVSDLQANVTRMGVADLVRVVSGIEVTPFAYGHFNAWPLVPDDTSPNKGAIDWARGMDGFGMLPAEVFDAMRARGAQLIQVNHPRGSGFTEFQAAWSRANLKYDYTNRTIFGDYMDASVPNDWLRLPGASLWSDQFNVVEVWNGFVMADTNGDGLRENQRLDLVMRDWFAMLSLGLYVTPTGNSDTHYRVKEPVGMPRTLVRVPDDSPAALISGAAVDAVLATQLGANQTPRDIVVTNGPMIDVKVNGMNALGRAFPASGSITLDVTITSPDWAEFDTLELFANATPDPVTSSGETALVPLKCYTSRTLGTLDPMDPCQRAPIAPEGMTVQLQNVGGPGNHRRYEASLTITLDASDIVTRTGATGTDAWVVLRARGDRGIFPLLLDGGAIDDMTRPAIMSGDFDMIRAALIGKGVSATAFTTPVFLDFDGGGYRAPFAP